MKHYGFGSRLLAWLCVVIMLAMMLPLSAAADGDPAGDETTYAVNWIVGEHGTVTLTANSVVYSSGEEVSLAADTSVTLTVTPEAGYKLKEVSAYYGSSNTLFTPSYSNPASESTYTFKMPADDIHVSVTFELRTSVTVSFEGDVQSVSNPSDGDSIVNGASATVFTDGYGADSYASFIVTPAEHFDPPESVEVKIGGNVYTSGDSAISWTKNASDATLSIPRTLLTADATVTVEGEEKNHVTIATRETDNWSHLRVTGGLGKVYLDTVGGDGYSLTLKADSHYELPDLVTIRDGESDITGGSWDKNSGSYTIPKGILETCSGKTIYVVPGLATPSIYTVTISKDDKIQSVKAEKVGDNEKKEEVVIGSGNSFSATVEDKIILTLTAKAYSELPESVTVTGWGTEGKNYSVVTAVDEAAPRTTGTITIERGDVTNDGTISITTAPYAKLIFELHGISAKAPVYQRLDQLGETDYSVELLAETGYSLPENVPENVKVEYGETTATAEEYTWNSAEGVLTIKAAFLKKAVDDNNDVVITVTADLNNRNYNSDDFVQDDVDEAGNVKETKWNDKAILIQPTRPATKIVDVEIGEKKYDDIYDGIIVGTDRTNFNNKEGKHYLEIDDCKNQKITYSLSDGTVKSAEGALYVSVDTTAPKVEVLSYKEGDVDFASYKETGNRYVNEDKDITVTFTVDEDNFDSADDSWEVSVKKGGVAAATVSKVNANDNAFVKWNGKDCTVTLACGNDSSAGKFADGEYTVSLTVRDKAYTNGNTKHSNTATSGTIVLDTTDPDVGVTSYKVGGVEFASYKETGNRYVNGSIAITFEVTEKNFDKDLFKFEGLPDTDGSYSESEWSDDGDVHTITLTLTADGTNDGVYNAIRLAGKDMAGNKGEETAAPIVLDKTAPVVDVTSYSINSYSSENSNHYTKGEISVTFDVSDTNFVHDELGKYAVSINDEPTTAGITWSGDGKQCTVTLNCVDETQELVNELSDGEYKVKLTVTDAAGNSNSESSETLVLDKTAPTIVSVTYEDKGGFVELLNQIWWWIAGKLNPDTEADGYSRTVKATVEISDNLSPVDVDALEVLPELKVKNLKVVTAKGTEATYTFEASSQFMEQLKITATDAAGNTCGAFDVQMEGENAKYSPNLLIDTYAPIITFNEIDYATVHSSNYPVTVTVTDPKESNVYSGLKQVTVSVHYQQSAANVNSGSIDGYDYRDGVYTKDFVSDKYTQEEKFTVTLPVNLHSNLVYVEVTAVDYAGNTVKATTKDNGQYIKLDSVAPVVSVVYDNNSAQNSKYFMQSRTATITVTDNNFSADGMTINTQGTVGGWTATGATNDDGQQNVYTCTVSYASDADYTLNVTAVDFGGNTTNDAAVDYSGQTAAQDFTVDLTSPTFTIGMMSGDAEIRSSGYSNQDVTVTITVNEHNFDSSAATAGLTVIHEGEDISQSIRSSLSWSNNGDVRTATFVLTDDGEYTINLSFQDLAGNSTAVASDVVVYVDQTNPLVYVTGVADKSANAQKQIVPVVTVWDKYYDSDSVVIRLRNGAGQDVTSKYLDMENDRSEVLYDEQRDMYYQTFTFKNITDDHVYRLEVRHTDLAGNTNTTMTVLNAKGEETDLDMEKEVMRFSVNRNGSTYSADDDTLEILGKYIQSAKNVRILEINVDELDPDSIYITLTHDNITRDLANGDDYTYQVPPEQNEASWNVYEYVFADGLFADDGVYTISIYSVDAAGNVAQNNTEEKDFEITFVVDKTPPIFVALNLEAGEIYNEEQHAVTINCSDNIAFDSVQVYRLDSTAEKDEYGNYIWFRETSDGEKEMLCEPVELTAVEGGNGDYTFVIHEGDSAATSKQSVLVVCTDKAGNQNVEQEILDFTVSSSFWIRFYANKPLFYGSIGGISALLILAAILFLTKRREEK